jgi:sulfonate transport system permease protein
VARLSCRVERATDLVVELLRPIPGSPDPARDPVVRDREASKIYIIFWRVLPDRRHRLWECARRSTGSSRRDPGSPCGRFVRHVVVPGAMPVIMSSLRLGLGIAWMCVVAAELIAASSGVGYLIMDARQLSQPDVVLVGMITIGLVGKAMDVALRRLERRASHGRCLPGQVRSTVSGEPGGGTCPRGREKPSQLAAQFEALRDVRSIRQASS